MSTAPKTATRPKGTRRAEASISHPPIAPEFAATKPGVFDRKSIGGDRTGSNSPPLGRASVVRQLRSVLFSEVILGAASVRPKGYSWSVLSLALGWFAPLLSRRATDPLPPSILYLAVTEADLRIFGKPSFSNLFEIGRWKKGSYRASVRQAGLSVKLDLDLERLGRVTVSAGRDVAPVFDLVLRNASGPV